MCGTVAWLQQCRDDEQFDLAAWFHKHSDHHSSEWWAFFFKDKNMLPLKRILFLGNNE
jgi:hypothetical protein